MHQRIGQVLDGHWLWICARILLGLVFLCSGLAGVFDAQGGQSLAGAGASGSGRLLHIVTIAVQVCGAVLIMLGQRLWLGAAALAALLLATLFVFHPFWQSPQPLAEFPMHWALKDAALIGGLTAAAIADRLRQRLRTALELYAGVPPRQAGR
ncbi:DoxX family membrane protein [Achromobacter xylosoxidans]|uniref:DoxX family membrane protein n=1 Tax=Alcaligenes xylosoxydans xylosoxydans TaxID=85698 RepID=UPI0006C363D0|nr:DoxX family membrane protein [Achromobacter xylosoxidans]MDH0521268.1 DoxX family membrane protein [Achromobacter xylosoxidans]MDH0545064.1 DoxX family membrane protein [Achromobacter xylosoxidans]OMG77422.1 hypothetical protein BI147_14745 [Achromobacter xylosoxidans]CUI61014.1 DoxX [Achromobacter xylosoxidans]